MAVVSREGQLGDRVGKSEPGLERGASYLGVSTQLTFASVTKHEYLVTLLHRLHFFETTLSFNFQPISSC